MKIAVSALENRPSGPVDLRFGRATLFLVTSDEGATWQTIDNSAIAEAAQGAGIQTSQRLVDAGVEAIITGHVGPKAFAVLQSGKVAMFSVQGGTIEDAVKAWKAGSLTRLDGADVRGHWGGR